MKPLLVFVVKEWSFIYLFIRVTEGKRSRSRLGFGFIKNLSRGNKFTLRLLGIAMSKTFWWMINFSILLGIDTCPQVSALLLLSHFLHIARFSLHFPGEKTLRLQSMDFVSSTLLFGFSRSVFRWKISFLGKRT